MGQLVPFRVTCLEILLTVLSRSMMECTISVVWISFISFGVRGGRETGNSPHLATGAMASFGSIGPSWRVHGTLVITSTGSYQHRQVASASVALDRRWLRGGSLEVCRGGLCPSASFRTCWGLRVFLLLTFTPYLRCVSSFCPSLPGGRGTDLQDPAHSFSPAGVRRHGGGDSRVTLSSPPLLGRVSEDGVEPRRKHTGHGVDTVPLDGVRREPDWFTYRSSHDASAGDRQPVLPTGSAGKEAPPSRERMGGDEYPHSPLCKGVV